MSNYRLTDEDKQIIFEMYKAHFTAKEVAEQLPFSYSTIIAMFRVYDDLNIKKYDRLQLIRKAG